MRRAFLPLSIAILLALVVACRAPAEIAPARTPVSSATVTTAPVVATAAPATPPRNAIQENRATAPPPTATPIYTGPLSPPCGLSLSALPADGPAASSITLTDEAALRAIVPTAAWPAIEQLRDAPETVGLVAYQAGRETEGIYWNADTPMPLASVAKVITLVAYVEAVAAGELNPQEIVPLAELERFYLPNFDLGAHQRALAELRAGGRLLSPDNNPAVPLSEVPWMMIRHSSNAAADYLHLRLGQARIEDTARALGLDNPTGSHSAPCPFLGQFLLMANHTRTLANDAAALTAYFDDETAYGRDVALLADAYAGQAEFRAAEVAWRERNRRPSIDTQRAFAVRLAPRGTPRAYAALMALLAGNGLSNADSSFQARRYLEWPNQFENNLAWGSNIGYKNGALPGVLTTVYYAYRWDDPAAIVVALFYRDLRQDTYRRWRNDLPHDELARWLLADPAAIPALTAATAP